MSPKTYNARVGMALCCPITTRAKGYAFEVPLPAGGKIVGVVLADHIKNVDWRARGAKRIDRAPAEIVSEAWAKIKSLLDPAAPV